ncbi:hypothetical protein ABK040_009260 [Willaertia magna]
MKKQDFPKIGNNNSNNNQKDSGLSSGTLLIGGTYVPIKKHSKSNKKGGNVKSVYNNEKKLDPIADKAEIALSKLTDKFKFTEICRKHSVLGNCTNCGKIITADEGYGSCSFCKQPFHPDQFNRYFNSIEDNQLPKNKLNEESYIKSLELRNRLLEWDSNFSQTTAVIDEQASEYSSASKDIWLSEDEKKEREKKEKRIKELKEQLNKKGGQPLKYIFDFTGKRILLDESHVVETQKELDKLIEELKTNQQQSKPSASKTNSKASSSSASNNKKEGDDGTILREGLSNVAAQKSSMLDVSKLRFIETVNDSKKKQEVTVQQDYRRGIVQNHYFVDDEQGNSFNNNTEEEPECMIEKETVDGLEPEIEIQEPISTHEEDEGFCMSMHQPWCSLLVFGIKRHEGRTWPTEHRGRLWIASTAEEPTNELIKEHEDFYKDGFNRTQGFPSNYPTSVILGCVDVVACYSQEEYQEKIPQELQESESDYVFVCKNPRRLYMPLPISGKPKIYKLSKEQLEACQLGLKPLHK